MIELYPYQDKFVNLIRKALAKKYKHLLCQSPTGSGKTVIFSVVTNKAIMKGNKVLIITDRVELLEQTSKTVSLFGSFPYYFKAGVKEINKERSVFIAMAQTLRNRIKLDEWYKFIQDEIKVVIIDESHKQEFNYLFESGVLKDKIVLGFTATPYRTGGMRQLGLDYEKIIGGPSIKYLIQKEKLVNCDIYDCGAPDMTNVAMNRMKGDYNETQMFNVFNTAKLYKGLVKNYKKHTPNQKMIVFCCNIRHAIKTTVKLNKAGYDAKFICSGVGQPKPPPAGVDDIAARVRYNKRLKNFRYYKDKFDKYSGERTEIINGFKNNDFKILVNVDILTTGFDVADIEVVSLYRATMSLTLYLQMMGRGGRISKGKTHFTVFDFGDNKSRFGGYDNDRSWFLWHESKAGNGIPPMKECGINSKSEKIKSNGEVEKGCRRLILATMKICPFCGFEYPERDEAKEIELELASIKDSKGISLKVKSFEDMDHFELHQYRSIKKHKMAWLWRQLWIRGEANEIKKFAEQYHWSRAQTERAINYCKAAY